MTMMWVGIGSAGAGLLGSVYSSNKAAEAAEEANSGELPEWLKPYILGDGSVPEWLTQQPKTNSNWLDYIGNLGQGDTAAPWQPMNENALQFHPERQFTPEDDGSQYGALPPGMNEPPPQAMPPPQELQGRGYDDLDRPSFGTYSEAMGGAVGGGAKARLLREQYERQFGLGER